MKVGDLVRDKDNDIGIIVELDDTVSDRVVVYYAALGEPGERATLNNEEKYQFLYEDQLKVICEGR